MTDLRVAPRWLSAEQQRVWRSYLLGSARLSECLDADLRDFGLDLAEYEILVALSEAPERRLRMTELADRVLLSRSGLTRLADRLERDGLLTRVACPSDARGTLAVLTDDGLARLERAWPSHRASVEEHVTGRYTAEEIKTLGALLGKLVPEGSPEDASGGRR